MSITYKTIASYPLTGTREFVIPFEYLARKFIVVTLTGPNKRLELSLNTDYRFATKTLISTNQAFTAGEYTQIEIRRFTSATDRLVNFTDGSILRAGDLNLSAIQSIHIAEEARDLTFDLMGLDSEFNYDAKNHKIVNMADGENPQDAVTFKQLYTESGAAHDSAARSEAAAKLSETARDVASVSAIQAVAAATTAVNSANSAKSSEEACVVIEDNMAENWYRPAKVFAQGLTIDSVKDTVLYQGSVYSASPAAIPFVTTSVFDANQWILFSNLGRVELAQPTGADLVGYHSPIEAAGRVGDRLRLLDGIGRNVGAKDGQFGGAVNSLRDTTNVVGGQHGWVNAGIFNRTIAGKELISFEWGMTSVLENFSDVGENVAVYGQGNKLGLGPTWAGCFEARDKTNNQNTSGLIGIEVDVFANGSDDTNNRVAIDVVVGKGVTDPAAQACQAAFGLRIGPQDNNPDYGHFKTGIQLKGYMPTGIEINTGGTFGIQMKGDRLVGLELGSTNCTVAAIRIKSGNKIALDEAGEHHLSLVNGSALQYSGPTGSLLTVADTGELSLAGGLSVIGKRVVGEQVKGWPEINGGFAGNFDPATATLTTVADRLAALINSLRAHGLISE